MGLTLQADAGVPFVAMPVRGIRLCKVQGLGLGVFRLGKKP